MIILRVFLCYPSGNLFQRGEDRCQSNIKASTATSMRACNDLGYMASVLKKHNHSVFLRDYQTEYLSYESMLNDIYNFNPDYLVVSTTNATIFDDIKIVNRLKSDLQSKKISFKSILKGAIFYDAPYKLLDLLDLSNIDILVGGEIEFIISDIIESSNLKNISGIFYKDSNNIWYKTRFNCWEEDIDKLPFPDRELMNNSLYVRPDTGEPMATIQTSRGCPSSCIYCLTPIISGKKVRCRSPKNVFDEIKECYDKYGIHNFFFKADTFTINRKWVLELCGLIKNSYLNGKISYTVNSRVNPISEDVLQALKDTGCFMIAFGFETGSESTMKLIKKGANIDSNKRAMNLCKKIGLPVFGFFMIGFPWETIDDIKATRKHIFELSPDFIELHIALPYYGSNFYDLCKLEGTLKGDILGTDYFHSTTKGTKYISIDNLLKFRKKLLLSYHCRPTYILKKLYDCKFSPKIILNYVKYGLRLVYNAMKG